MTLTQVVHGLLEAAIFDQHGRLTYLTLAGCGTHVRLARVLQDGLDNVLRDRLVNLLFIYQCR